MNVYKRYLIIFCLLQASSVYAMKILIMPVYTKSSAIMYGQTGSVPSYEGNLIGGNLDINFGYNSLSFGPYVSKLWGDLQNTANSDEQKEKMQMDILSYGLKFQSTYFFIKGGLFTYDNKNTTSGTVEQELTFASKGYELGVGLRYNLFRSLQVVLGYDTRSAIFTPDNSNITTRLDFYEKTIYLGINIVLPSSFDVFDAFE